MISDQSQPLKIISVSKKMPFSQTSEKLNSSSDKLLIFYSRNTLNFWFDISEIENRNRNRNKHFSRPSVWILVITSGWRETEHCPQLVGGCQQGREIRSLRCRDCRGGGGGGWGLSPGNLQRRLRYLRGQRRYPLEKKRYQGGRKQLENRWASPIGFMLAL